MSYAIAAYRFNTFTCHTQLHPQPQPPAGNFLAWLALALPASVFIFISKQAINFILISNTFDSQPRVLSCRMFFLFFLFFSPCLPSSASWNRCHPGIILVAACCMWHRSKYKRYCAASSASSLVPSLSLSLSLLIYLSLSLPAACHNVAVECSGVLPRGICCCQEKCLVLFLLFY